LEQHSENPTPRLVLEAVWEAVCEPDGIAASAPEAMSSSAAAAESSEQPDPNQQVNVPQQSASIFAWPEDAGIQIIRATRSWIQYGTVGFAVMCIVIGAVEALLGH